MFAESMLTQLITYWPSPSSSPVLMRARWSVSRKHLYTVGQTQDFPQGSIISHQPLALGGLAALGDASAAVSLLQVSTLHWVKHSKYTADFSGSNGLYRSDVKPVWAEFGDTIRVFPETKTQTTRSFSFARAASPAYEGIASVSLVDDSTAELYEGQFNQKWQVMITVPKLIETETIDRAEIEWGGKIIHIEGGALRDRSGNPLAITWGGTLRDAV